jgi:hypothetical protein
MVVVLDQGPSDGPGVRNGVQGSSIRPPPGRHCNAPVTLAPEHGEHIAPWALNSGDPRIDDDPVRTPDL